jgi:trypsin
MLKRAALLVGVLLVVTAGAKPVVVGGTVASTTEAPWAIALNNTQSIS